MGSFSIEDVAERVFYHGSPYANIADFRADFLLEDAFRTSGVFFTQLPTLAARYAGCGLGGGRVYRARLTPKNLHVVKHWEDWAIAIGLDKENRQPEQALIAEYRSAGFDAIISQQAEGVIREIIILDEQAIEICEEDIGPLDDWATPDAVDSLLFYRAANMRGPAYSPDCIQLFGSRGTVDGAAGGSVLVNPLNPIYCDQSAWPHMDFDNLRRRPIDVLIDPRDRSALVIDPSIIKPLNRLQKRMLRKEQRRGRINSKIERGLRPDQRRRA